MRFAPVVAALLVPIMVAGAGFARAQGPVLPASAPVPPASEWARGNRITLGMTQEALGFSAQWRFERSEGDEVRIDKEEQRAGRQVVGEVLVIGSSALATRNLAPPPGRELDELNGPLAMLQLAIKLLERAAPGGPASVARDTRIEISDDAQGIKVTGLGAESEFFAPWRARGVIGPGRDGRVRFELEFSSTRRAPGARGYVTALAGIWERAQDVSPLPDAHSLAGWRVHQVRQVVRQRGEFNTVGIGASAPMAFPTIGALRRSVGSWVDESSRRARHQCN